MLNNIEYKTKYQLFAVKELGIKLARLQRIAQNLKIPALVIVEGWEASGRGHLIYNLIRELNPKYYDVKSLNDLDENFPKMQNFWINSPQKSHLQIFDKSYYNTLLNEINIDDKRYKNYIESIKNFEKAFYDDYTIVIKLFININEEKQKENIEEYLKNKYKNLYIDELDENQNKNYNVFLKNFNKVLSDTNFDFASWNILNGENIKDASKEAIGILIDSFESGIERIINKRKNGEILSRNYIKNDKLSELNLTLEISDEEYDKELKDLQKRAAQLQLELSKKNISSVLVFEGVDAAGKDGAIERLIKYMDPRMVKVNAISAPNEEEKNHNYLWRFYKRLPKDGNMAIFSRSWYGRVMVERIEGFAQQNEWERAYQEITNFEKEIYNHGSLVIKFFVMIDKDTQLKRFEDRENNPDKQYKITEEDWRNRKKWDEYIDAMNEMLDRTDVKYAPWIIVEGNDKKYARIKVLKEFIKAAEEKLK